MTTDPSLKEKTVRELFAETLEGEYNDVRPLRAVRALCLLATPEVFQRAVEFSNSPEPLKRARGINVLAEIGMTVKTRGPHFDERVSICILHISDKDALVVRAVASALGQLQTEECIQELIKLADHTDAVVRGNVALGLGGLSAGVDGLLKLIEDEDDHVRGMATLSLGLISTDDTPAIREALKRRLNDTDKGWAISGLALRKDPIGLKALLDHLEQLKVDEGEIGDTTTAAEILGLPEDTPVSDLCAGLRKVLKNMGN